MIDIKKTVNLDTLTQMDRLPGFVYRGENNGHTFLISCEKSGQAVTLTGAVTAKLMRADGAVIAIVGAVVGGAAKVQLPGNAYVVPGQFILAIYNTNGDDTTAIYAASGAVIGLGEQGDEIPASNIDISFNEILERIAAAESQALSSISTAKTQAQNAIATDKASAQSAIASDKAAAAASASTATSAKTAAEAARDAAAQSNTNAQAAKTAAETAQAAAEAAQAAAEAAAEETAEYMDGAGKDIRRYGASGWSLSSPGLTRLYDAASMVAEDPSGQNPRNDFDFVKIWARRKCVGNWTAGNGKAVFTVQAYKGDPDYTEDGSKGDYVAVECYPAYVWDDGDTRIVSDFKLPGYRPFAILETEPGSGVCRDRTYLPAYQLALDNDGHAVSRPGFAHCQGSYAQLLANVKTYANTEVQTYAMMEPAAMEYYEETLFGIEYATKNTQAISMGLCNVRRNSNDRVTYVEDADGDDVFDIAQNIVDATAEYVWIGETGTSDSNPSKYPTHRIKSRVSGSGSTLARITCERLSEDTYTVGTEYEILGRNSYTGVAAYGEKAGHTPARYRERDNLWGGQWRTCHDMFALLVDVEGEKHLDWYYMPDPTAWQSGNPNEAALKNAEIMVKLGVQTEPDYYKTGWATGRLQDPTYRDLWIPVVGSGGSASKYFGDYASLAHSHVVRALRRGGYESNGADDGVSAVSAYNAPSSSNSIYGAGLYFVH